MIDPGTALNIATEGASVCVKVIHIIKRFVEAVKNVRKDLLGLLRQTERMRNIFTLLKSLVLALMKTSDSSLELAIDDRSCLQTMRELFDLADNIAATTIKSSLIGGMNWGIKKNKAEALSRRLREQEDEIMTVVIIIGTTSSLRTQYDVKQLKQTPGDAELQSAFKDLKIVDDTLQAPGPQPDSFKPLRTWLGHILTERYPEAYIIHRTALSDAVYWGDWSQIWDLLKTGHEEYGESWANAIRMKPLGQSREMSFWTPLHQAVYNRAPIDVVQKLIKYGASRVIRTRWTEYEYSDMSPLELARYFGFTYLFDILSPVIHSPIPEAALRDLQERFHELIRTDLGSRVENEKLYLPMLEVLTELRDEVMWFPVKFSHKAMGYAFRLDGRDLVVKSYNITAPNERIEYRITADETYIVDEAFIISD